MEGVIEELVARTGRYQGSGSNHEDERYNGRLDLVPVLGGRGVVVMASASATDGTLFHEEHTLIAQTRDGLVGMWSMNIQQDGVLFLEFREDVPVGGAEHSYVFGHGDPADNSAYRIEIAFDLWADGDISQRYAWGMPGGKFSHRSGARMRRMTEEIV